MKIKITLSKDRILEFLLGLDIAFIGLLLMIVFTGAPVFLFFGGIILAFSSLTDKEFIHIDSESKVEKIMILVSFVIFLSLILLIIINEPRLFTFECLFIYNCLFS
jgi:hypothetical protein